MRGGWFIIGFLLLGVRLGQAEICPDDQRSARIKLLQGSGVAQVEDYDGICKADWGRVGQWTLGQSLATLVLTESGQQVWQKLLPLIQKQRLKLRTLAPGSATAGAYHAGKLYLDVTGPLVAIGATLIHELKHAMDWLESEESEILWQKMVHPATAAAERDKLLVASEVAAYSAQNQFLYELSELDPNIRNAINAAVADRFLLAAPVTRKQLRQLLVAASPGGYGVSESSVDEALSSLDYFEKSPAP